MPGIIGINGVPRQKTRVIYNGNTMKKTLVIIIIIAAVVLIALGVYLWLRTRTTPAEVGTTGSLPVVSGTISTAFPTSTTLTLGTSDGNVTIKNFYNNASYITQDQQAVVIQENVQYTIVYNVGDSSFVISLLSTPLEAARQAAESAFLSALGISEQDACKLEVYEGVPISISDEYPGESFPLSFCGGPATL